MRHHYAVLFFTFSVCIKVWAPMTLYTITKDLVNNTHSWFRPTRRWTRNSSRCCTSTDWICSNSSFRIETPGMSQNWLILQSKSQRNRCRYPICRPQQNCINMHNDITYIFLSIRYDTKYYFVCTYIIYYMFWSIGR